jgi:hypothetical protein
MELKYEEVRCGRGDPAFKLGNSMLILLHVTPQYLRIEISQYIGNVGKTQYLRRPGPRGSMDGSKRKNTTN